MKGQLEKEKQIKEAEEKRRLQEEKEGIGFVYLMGLCLAIVVGLLGVIFGLYN